MTSPRTAVEERIRREGEIQVAAAEAHAANHVLLELIRKARHDGMSLRSIAAAASMSHEQVRRITSGS